MKCLAVMLVLLLAAPPAQEGSCPMDRAADSDAHVEMQHGGDADGMAHDCCASADSAGDPDSGGGSHCNDRPCGSCVAGVAAIPPLANSLTMAPAGFRSALGKSPVSPSHASPPYRPPITLS